MFKKFFSSKRWIASLLAPMLIPGSLMFAVMGSSNYKIQLDSLNFGGGLSSSPSYTSESTFGELGTGVSTSANYSLSAGYQSMSQVYIALRSTSNITLPSISGLAGGTSNSTSSWNVLTDDPAGYSLSIRSSTSPALTGAGGSYISDYAPGGAAPDYAFTTPSNQSQFGFSPEGPDIVQRYRDNGSACNTGSSDTSLACWDGLSLSDRIISQSTAANQPTGATTTLQYEVQIGTAKNQEARAYSATITVTAVAL